MAIASLTLSAGLFAAPPGMTAPGRADSTSDAFLKALTDAGVPVPDRGRAVEAGKSVCPMLATPGQSFADVAAKMADTAGMGLGPSTMFTGIAISIFCPAMMSRVGNAQLPVLGGR